MKILITNFWTQTNNGDAAILSSTLVFLLNLWPKADINFVSMHKDSYTTPELQTNPTPTLHFLQSPPKNSTAIKYLEFLYNLFSSMVWIFFYRTAGIEPNVILKKNMRQVAKAYLESDIIMPIGGGYLTATKGLKSTIFYLTLFYPIFLGTALKKRVVLLWQSIGPFGSSFQKKVAGFILKKVELIFAREKYTISMLKTLGIPSEKIIDSGDIAFYFHPQTKELMKSELQNLGVDFGRPLAGVTARHWFSKGSNDESRYIKSLVEAIKYLESKNYQIILLPQVTSIYDNLNDRNFLEKIKKDFKDSPSVFLPEKEYNHFEYKGIYENLDFLIGTRMHSNIFALSGLVPVLAIAYEYKTLGIMNDLGLSEFVIDINNLTGEWIEQGIQKIENNRSVYLETLQNNLKNYLAKLDLSRQIMKELV